MPFVSLSETPLASDPGPFRIFFREHGMGDPLVFLHGGWGYSVYPFEGQIERLQASWRVIAPDRTGYGRSGRLSALGPDFHDRAALETFAVLDALGIGRPVVWGHSDGAVIAAKMALAQPDRIRGVLLEALHFRRDKPGSRAFFEAMARDPGVLGDRVLKALAVEHGDDYWRTLLNLNGLAWLAIASDGAPTADLYDGRLPSLRVPAAILHGRRDPRTEPGELDEIIAALPHASVHVIDEGAHSPHSERLAEEPTARAAAAFLATLR
jgi:3-oxoadipate enol-lactonase